MKKQTIKSLIAISIFNVTFLISAMGQIIYTDVNPDITLNTWGGIYHLDLNNDTNVDFDIFSTSISYSVVNCGTLTSKRILIKSFNNNEVLNSSYVNALSANMIIDSTSQIWHDDSIQFMALQHLQCTYHPPQPPAPGYWFPVLSYYGNWNGVTDKYLGLKIRVGAFIYYGWARLSEVNSGTYPGTTTMSFTIKDYAYNSIPNQPILAGQTTTTGITENISSKRLSIYPNPATNSVTIKFPSDDGGEIQIINLFDCVVETRNCSSLRDGALQIDVSKFPTGMYVVRWNSGENFQTEKFSVIH